MQKHFTWNKGIFDNNYQIFENGTILTTMFFDTLRTEAQAITQKQTYVFKDDGLFEPNTQIFNGNAELIGTITYDLWKTKAMITMKSGDQYFCDFVNVWHSKWMITDQKQKLINYDSSTSSGMVIANTDDELMLLLGFYIREHFTKIFVLILLAILFIPIMTRGVF